LPLLLFHLIFVFFVFSVLFLYLRFPKVDSF
jgi:hypothetical protein